MYEPVKIEDMDLNDIQLLYGFMDGWRKLATESSNRQERRSESMTEMEILYSDLHDIYDILEDNGYGAWCRTIRKAVELLEKHEEQVQSWTKQISDKQIAHASDIRDSVEESTYNQGVKTGLKIALDIIKQGS